MYILYKHENIAELVDLILRCWSGRLAEWWGISTLRFYNETKDIVLFHFMQFLAPNNPETLQITLEKNRHLKAT